MIRILVVFAIVAALAGCGTVFTPPGEIPVSKSLSPAAQAAQSAINEGNVLITAAANVVSQNVADGVTTQAEARGQAKQLRELAADLDRAQQLLKLGDVGAAKDRAELTRRLVVTLHKEIAARSRSRP